MTRSEATPDAQPAREFPFNQQRILIVEDDKAIADLTTQLLQDRGLQVVGPAPTLSRAIELIQSEMLDGAILDVNLGLETSFAAAVLLKERGIPFFFTTAFAYRPHPEVSNDTCLAKPYRARELVETLRGVLARG